MTDQITPLPQNGGALPRQPLLGSPDQTEIRVLAVDGRDALAYVLIKPAPDGQDGVAVEAAADGLSKQDAAEFLRRIAHHWDPLPDGAEDLRLKLDAERMRGTAILMAAEGHWSADLRNVVANREHPYWSPALDAVVALAGQPTATAAGRPDGTTTSHLLDDQHTWTQMRPGQFVCLQCPDDGPADNKMPAPWPCPEAVQAQPSLQHYNNAWPVGTPITFAPHGVGDPEQSTTSTPVWLGKNDQPYVSVHAYPPARGAALKLSDLVRLTPDPTLRAIEVLDRHGQ